MARNPISIQQPGGQRRQGRSPQAGFTLIELVIVAGLLSVLMITISTMFMTTLTSNLRTSSRQQIKEEGGYVLNQLEFMLRNAAKIDASSYPCAVGMHNFQIVNPDGGKTEFALSGSQVASNGAALHSSLLMVPNPPTDGTLTFDCDRNPSGEYYVDVSFSLTRSDTNITENFRHLILMRNK